MVGHACNASTWEVEVGGPGVQGRFRLYKQFQATLDHRRGRSRVRKTTRQNNEVKQI